MLLRNFASSHPVTLRSRSPSLALALTIVAGLTFAVTPEKAVADAAVADQEHRHQEHQTADRARFPLQEESDKIQHDEHDVRLHQRRIRGLRNQQHRNQTLQTVHGGAVGVPERGDD